MDPGNVNVIMVRSDSTTLDDRFVTSTNELACRRAAVNSTRRAIVTSPDPWQASASAAAGMKRRAPFHGDS
jgi:hypothetical protein